MLFRSPIGVITLNNTPVKDAELTSEEEADGTLAYTMTVKNYPDASLPVTGGSGTLPFTIIGTVLIAASAFIFVRRFAH